MNKNIENIAELLAAKDNDRAQVIAHGKQEIEEIENRIKSLKDITANPRNIEEYTAATQDLKASQEYLDYIRKKQQQILSGRLLNEQEYQDIKTTLTNEINNIQAAAAPDLEQAILHAVALMTEYNSKIKEITTLLYHAGRYYSPNYSVSMKNYGSGIAQLSDSRANWLQKFVNMYYCYIDEAQRIENNAPVSSWLK